MKYYWDEDGQYIAVLVSSGYGAGWSTWNQEELAYDRRVVEFWLTHHNSNWIVDVMRSSLNHKTLPETDAHREARLFFAECGYSMPYFGGYGNIELKWVPAGVYWRITEYDGAEHLEFFDESRWNYVEVGSDE